MIRILAKATFLAAIAAMVVSSCLAEPTRPAGGSQSSLVDGSARNGGAAEPPPAGEGPAPGPSPAASPEPGPGPSPGPSPGEGPDVGNPEAGSWSSETIAGGASFAFECRHRNGDRVVLMSFRPTFIGTVVDLIAKTASAISTTGRPPTPLYSPVCVGAEGKVIVWSGLTQSSGLATGGYVYDIEADTWTAMATSGAPLPRQIAGAFADESKVLIFGGYDVGSVAIETLGLYDAAADTWTAPTETNKPDVDWAYVQVFGRSGTWVIADLRAGNGGKWDQTGDAWTTTTLPAAVKNLRKCLPTSDGPTGAWACLDESDAAQPYRMVLYESQSDIWSVSTSTQLVDDGASNARRTLAFAGPRLLLWSATGFVYDPGTGVWTPTAPQGFVGGAIPFPEPNGVALIEETFAVHYLSFPGLSVR